jgi:hypothetical protein
VPNWRISRNYKENWKFTKLSVTTGIHLTRGGSVQSPLTSGSRRWLFGQTPWLADPTLQHLMGLLNGHTLQEVVTRNPKLKGGGSRTRWPAGHVAWSVGHDLAPNRPLQVGRGPIHTYKYDPHSESRDTTLYL